MPVRRRPGRAGLRGAVPRDVPRLGRLALEQAVARLSRRLEDAVGDGLLLVEDLHWADPASLDVLTSFATAVLAHLRSARLLVTSRPLTDDGDAAAWWTAVSRDLPSTSIELRGMSGPEVFGLLHHATGREPSPALADLLCERAGGNPLLALTGLEGLRSGGGLQSDGDVLSPATAEFRAVPADLRTLLSEVEQALPPVAQELLAEAALFQGDPPVADLPSAVGLAEADARAALRRIEDAGLLAERGGRLVFRHDLYRRVLADVQPPAARRARHQAIIERLLAHQAALEPVTSAVGALRELARELAHHAEQVPDVVPPGTLCEIMRRAGLHALGDLDWPSAAR
jgi:predicted ATPase